MRRVYARNTTVKTIDIEIAQAFIEKHHSQASSKSNIRRISIALFSEDELVAVAQFCSPRTAEKKRKYSTELLRMCFKKDVQVIGGASKMIAFFIKKYKPTDLFTYQDTTGENTDVYEKCGFTLVSQNKKKQYLVKNGKTIDTAKRTEKEIFTLSLVVQLGPDRILGTDLGEVFKEDGTRKTNIELFLDLGWHIEETTGDKVYEWFDPNTTFYTYKITATDSSKYYYGVSHVKTKNASIEECLNDGYYGSGGTKFKNWKHKHHANLQKEVLSTFDKKHLAYAAEKELVKESYKNDTLCLNSAAGGTVTGMKSLSVTTMKNCEIHGKTSFQGDSCTKCAFSANVVEKDCLIHKRTKFLGDKCYKCIADHSIYETECPIHGITKHRGNACYKCFMNELVSIRVCDIHGETKYQGDSCSKCAVEKTYRMKECSVHGLTKFSGNHCRKCSVARTVNMKECSIHGLTKHQGNVCNSCNALKSISYKTCAVHGETKFTGDKCRKCISAANNVQKECSIHGLANYRGAHCMKCSAQKRKHNSGRHEEHPDPLCILCQV